ncbi:LysR family transcriptional regulator [Azospirillum picis]|uniref:LysR family glycine cleavage system transcriptional activator n=1 Tax=Azospirillum picis TaxID=488438 RepID=A0ABU0MSJ1_9PROT|nr:LysR family transcriptional regulator [Azospirillum picis]MBP2302707.1 LysR family glycine cleavage system transcriptional activator [Azospirillum picis]MDQ0536458.1 LysR family glycine cleavage system transcriptional activator [Azospirillum picis]
MQSPRRFLPSLSLLSAFEAAARTGSITAAAKELSLTQGAVSRQIKALEEQLEVALFHREKQSIRLTAGGDYYVREIRDALRKIGSASLNLRANPFGGTLTIAVLPTFGARWLAPRLPGFLRDNPGITVNLMTRPSAFDFRLDPMDAAIHCGRPDWPGAELALLRRETVVPACSPDLRDRHGFRQAADLRRAPLLHLTSRPDAWERWLALHDAPADAVHGMLFDQFATAAQAAAAGLGLALLPLFLIEEELRDGRLVPALDLPMASGNAYYLAWPAERAGYPPLAAFRDWILAETRECR